MQNYFQKERQAWNKLKKKQARGDIEWSEVISGIILLIILLIFMALCARYSMVNDYNALNS